MHLRRALLLFAMVLVVAALATSLSPPADEREEGGAPELQEPSVPADAPEADDPAEVRFDAGAARKPSRELVAGSRAIVTVVVPEPGEVEIPRLGLLQPAAEGTPATFDVVPLEPGAYRLRFTPVEGRAQSIGELSVMAASEP